MPDFTPAAIKKAIGANRWAKVQACDFECGVLDLIFKPGWVHPGYHLTTFVLEPGYHEMTKTAVIAELKDFIDDMIYDDDLSDKTVNPWKKETA